MRCHMRNLHGPKAIILICFCPFLLAACALGLDAEDLAETMVVETAAVYVSQTQEADAAQTTEAKIAEETRAAESTHAQLMATETAKAEATREAATARANSRATQAAGPMAALLEEFADEGYLNSTDGEYFRLKAFNENYAAGPETSQDEFFGGMVSYYYDFFFTEYEPENFVLRADILWENVDEFSNRTAGCGYAFRVNTDTGNHYLTWLSGYGQLNYIRNVNYMSEFMKNVPTGPLGFPYGGAEFTLVVEDATFHAFVNGEHLDTRHDSSLGSGELAFTIMSGDSRSFGTRCRISNIDLWILE